MIRFNRWISWLEAFLSSKAQDDLYYVQLVTHFKTGFPESIKAPFGYRVVIPYFASYLPFNSETSINILNAFAFLSTIFILRHCLNLISSNSKLKNYLLLLYIFSFPSAYYITIGYLDVWLTLLASLAAMVHLMKKHWLLYLFILIIGVGIKESVLVLLPLMTLSVWLNTMKAKSFNVLKFALTSIMAWIITYYLIRQIAPASNSSYMWWPDLNWLINNLNRPRMLPAFLLSFGIQGMFLTWIVIFRKMSPTSIWTVGTLSFVTLWIYALTSAYADGRFIWPGMVFSTLAIAHYYAQKSKNPKSEIISL
jgi:hypothetical protein